MAGRFASFRPGEASGFTATVSTMIDRSPNQVTYFGADQPDVEVLVDGEWCEGELRSWVKVEDGWRASVQWRRGPGEGTYFQDFAEDDVRLDTRPVRPAP